MRILAIGLWIISIGVTAYVQLWYARKGYPKTWALRVRLFLSGFLSGALGAWSIFMELPHLELLLLLVLAGIYLGLLFTFLMPRKMKAWIPEQQSTNPPDRQR